LLELDSLDRKLLAHLDCEAALTFSELARRVRVGNDIVAYRFERLVSSGILRKCSVIVDPEILGTSIVKSYLRLSNKGAGRSKLIEHVSKSRETCWMAEVFGGWDLILSVYASSPREYEAKFRGLLGRHISSVLEVRVFHLTEQWKDSRQFGRKEPRKTVYFGRDRAEIKLDRIEVEILRELSNDSRQSYVEIAKKLSTTPQVVKYRIQQLEASNVIAGYVLNLDISKLGLIRFKTAVHIKNWEINEEKRLIAFLRKQSEITTVIRQIGPWQLEFDAETDSIKSFGELLSRVREEFPDYVEYLEHVVYQDDFSFRIPQLLPSR